MASWVWAYGRRVRAGNCVAGIGIVGICTAIDERST
jgi:hypothetical protein